MKSGTNLGSREAPPLWGSPEHGRQRRQCEGRCKQARAEGGGVMMAGKWICGECYRNKFFSARSKGFSRAAA